MTNRFKSLTSPNAKAAMPIGGGNGTGTGVSTSGTSYSGFKGKGRSLGVVDEKPKQD
eukprot:gnl/Chilomastix_caulleri/1938.p1 GENE.gnl/Chilomastix_caulleri/1938~~gnl/Chilomastix_caulleri/1938.p1  ORF type:complete len:57 (+),score=11.72 gnl/Chilomastix_caulleri/1938:177-347(+)